MRRRRIVLSRGGNRSSVEETALSEVECPEWLKPYSDVYNERAQDDEEDDTDGPFKAALPVCDEDEPDARVMHSVLRAWGVSFQDMVLHTPFLKLWFALSNNERRAIIEEEGNMVYFHELDVGMWRLRMLERDDTDMCRAVLALRPPPTPDPRYVRGYVLAGATKCLQVLQTSEGWSDETTVTKLQAVYAMNEAASAGRVRMLQDLRRRGMEWGDRTMNAAAAGGHPETMKFLHNNGCPWHESTMLSAVRTKCRECLRYALENGCPGAEDVCASIARWCRLSELKFAHKNGLPWDTRTCAIAAEWGHFKCLKYAHEEGCPWDTETTREAARNNREKEFMYAYYNGCPVDARMCHHATTSRALRGFLEREFPELRPSSHA